MNFTCKRFLALRIYLLLLLGFLVAPLIAVPPVTSDLEVHLEAGEGLTLDAQNRIEKWTDQANGHEFTTATEDKRPIESSAIFAANESPFFSTPVSFGWSGNYAGTFAWDFLVEEEISITELAAFDRDGDGFTGTITVEILERNDNGTPLSSVDDTAGTIRETLTFNTADPGTLRGVMRYKDVTAPLTLAPGSYTLRAWGFNSPDGYANQSSYATGPRLPGVKLLPGYRINSAAGSFPSFTNSNSLTYSGTANFTYALSGGAAGVARPSVFFDGSNDGLIGPEDLNIGRPSTVFAVLRRHSTDTGYLLQSSASPHWYFWTSRVYGGNGTVREAEVSRSVPVLTTITNLADSTHWELNGSDLTHNPQYNTGTPGRLAIGGGEGRSNSPAAVHFAEILVYNRELTTAEKNATERYLAEKYGVFFDTVASPEISPEGTPGTGNVTVTLTALTSGSQIRYTTDGSEPTAGSTLYAAPFSVTRGSQVRARAFVGADEMSGISSEFYQDSANPDLPVTGAKIWLRADRGVELDADGKVSRWNDLTENENDFLQGTKSQRPPLGDVLLQNSAGPAFGEVEGGSNRTYGGTLGSDFVVTEAMTISELGAWDQAGDGFGQSINVRIVSRDDAGTAGTPQDDAELAGVPLAEMEFTTADPGTLEDGFRYKPVTPVVLAPGNYTIYAWGFTGADNYRDTPELHIPEGQGYQFISTRYGSAAGVFPNIPVGGLLGYGGPGNFKFSRAGGTVERLAAIDFEGGNQGLWAVAKEEAEDIDEPSTVFISYFLESNNNGIFFQNTSPDPHVYLRRSLFYANGSVSSLSLPIAKKSLAVMEMTPGGSKIWLNGAEVTQNSSPHSTLGRLALGGGNGRSYSPSNVKIMELVVFDRTLDAADRIAMEEYINNRYNETPRDLEEVVISPNSGLVAANVPVTMTTTESGTQIRYTLDGSVPGPGSTLYAGEFSVPPGTTVRARNFLGSRMSDEISEESYLPISENLPVTGATVWLDANRGVNVGSRGEVYRWKDLTGNGYDVVQPLSEKRPQLLGSDTTSLEARAAIQVPLIAGNTTYSGNLGEFFTVNDSLEVTHLGAFDHNRDGFSGSVTVELWRHDDGGTPETYGDDSGTERIGTVTFSPSNPGELAGNCRYLELDSPETLPPGKYAIFAWGFTGLNYYRGTNLSRPISDSRITFAASSGFNSSSGSAEFLDQKTTGGFLYYTGAANFLITPTSATSLQRTVSFDGGNDGLTAVPGVDLDRPGTVFLTFERLDGSPGYLLQSSTNTTGHSYLYSSLFYTNGTVVNEELPVRKPSVATMIFGTDFSRFYLDREDLTSNSAFFGSRLGKFALGGGEGRSNDPIHARISQVIAFDRVLSEAEILTMQNYLGEETAAFPAMAETPEISPPSGYGTGDVSVTLSTATTTEIRYTTDGSEPTASSTLYSTSFDVSRGTTVKAQAYVAGQVDSEIAIAFYGDASNSPHPVNNAALWLRADRGVQLDENGAVSRWNDLSGNGHDFTQAKSSQKPEYRESSFPIEDYLLFPWAEGTAGTSTYDGSLASDFIVDEDVVVTGLAAFDDLSDGFVDTVTVQLHRLDDNGTPEILSDDTSDEVLREETFDSDDPGVLRGGVRVKALTTPLTLSPGRYMVSASGYDKDRYLSIDQEGRPQNVGITFPGASRFNSGTNPIVPGNSSFSGGSRYAGSANLLVRRPGPPAAAPVPAVAFDGANDGLVGPDELDVGRPSTVLMVFREQEGSDGRLIQNRDNVNNWLLGPHAGATSEGFYADGWVTQSDHLFNGRPTMVTGVSGPSYSTYYLNGDDITQNPLPTGVLGRVALGGGEGRYNQPVAAELVELIIFERELEQGELQQLHQSLAEAYGLPQTQLEAPEISPDGGLFAAGQNVELSHSVSGVEIRYTLDGSEPTEASSLYSSPLAVSTETLVRAKAFATGYGASPVEEAQFYFDATLPSGLDRSSLLVWLRADTGVELDATNGVERWRDVSGNGNDATQSDPDHRPTVTATGIGSAPSLNLDGVDDTLFLPAGFDDFTNGLTAIVVVKPSEVVQNYQRLFDLSRGAAVDNIWFGRQASTTRLSFEVQDNSPYRGQVIAEDAFVSESAQIFSVTLDPANGLRVFRNGSEVASDPSYALPRNVLRTINRIGSSPWSQDRNFSGEYAELILFNSSLTDFERETVESSVTSRYGIASTAAGTVGFSPDPADLYPGSVAVTLETVTAGAAIHYTLDGSVPDETSPLYSGPINLTESTRVRARAFAAGLNASRLNEATYLVGNPVGNGDGLVATYFDEVNFGGASLTRVDPNIAFDWAFGSPDPAIAADFFTARWTGKLLPRFTEDYQFSVISDDGVRLWIDLDQSGTFEDETELILDNFAAWTGSSLFSAPSTVALTAGQLYDVKFEYNEVNSRAFVTLFWESFSIPRTAIPQSQLFSNATFSQTVATPTISPGGGIYNAAVEVAIATATAGSTIYYTLDGTDPDEGSPVYGGPLIVADDTVVKAKAYKAGFNPSGTATNSYDIDAIPPMITSFTWEGAELNDNESLVDKGTLATTATDSQGIDSAEFYYQRTGTSSRVLIGRDTYPPNGLTVPWNIALVQDGEYRLYVRVFDNSGVFSEESRLINVALAVPDAPVITQPANNITVEDTVVQLRIEGGSSDNIRIFRDGIAVFSGYASSGNPGVMTYNASLQTGANVFTAVAVNRAGSSSSSAALTINRVRQFPALSISFPGNTVTEGSPITGTVSIPAAESADLVVTIATNRASQFEILPLVTIPAGNTSANFTLTPRQDNVIEILSLVRVTATASEHLASELELALADDDYPMLTIALDASSVSESDGSVVGTVSREVATPLTLRVKLVNSLPSAVRVPDTVTIPSGQKSVGFSAQIIDDDLDNGNRTADLGANVVVNSQIIESSPTVALEVRDDEGPALTITISPPVLNEGDSATVTVARSGSDNSSALPLSLTTTDPSQITLPGGVSIPGGQSQISFQAPIPTSSTSGVRTLGLRVSATSFTDGLTNFTVSDLSLPDLAANGLVAPEEARTEENISVSYNVNNFGPAVAEGPFLERIFLSLDPSPSGDDLLVRQIEQTGDVAGRGNYGRNVTILTPRQTGTYYMIVTLDAGGSVEESQENNNAAVRVFPITILPAYGAEVSSAQEVIPANTPITFTGSASKSGGLPAPFSVVNIHIKRGDSKRVISALTNSNGDFSTTWTPLRNEGGFYTIGATHPGVDEPPMQDTFEILTLGVDAPPYQRLKEGETVVANAVLRNPNARDLNGVQVQLGDAPDGLTLTANVTDNTIPAGGSITVPITISAAAGFSGSGTFPIDVTTAEGIFMQASLGLRVDLLVPTLTLDPTSLDCSVLRGTPKTASFSITNTGGLETGEISILLPGNIPWMTLASVNPIASLAPGESASVSLRLAPGADIPLTLFSGSIALNAANGGSKNVSFRFRVVSDLKGDLNVTVVDELYYFTPEAPKLEGATVVVRDAVTSAEVARKTTDSDGLASFTDLMEGWYRIDVSADEHDSFTGNYLVNAGEDNPQLIFTSKQLVKYTFTVEEVEIEDVYRVQIETTFETNVPAPVVTLSPARIDVEDLVALGQSKVVNVTLENHGFIAAQNSEFDFSDHPFYKFDPLIKNIGTIPAKSSLVVPVTITRVGVFGDDGGIVTLPQDGGATATSSRATKGSPSSRAGASVPCGAGGKLEYEYPCGPNAVGKAVAMAISGISGNCGSGDGGSGIRFIGGFYGGFGGAIGGGRGGRGGSGSSLSFSSPDPCLDLCYANNTLDCAIGYTPAGCPWAAGRCIEAIANQAFDGGSGFDTAYTCLTAPLCLTGPIGNTITCAAGYLKCYLQSDSGPFGSGSSALNKGSTPSARAEGTAYALGEAWLELYDQESRDFSPEMAGPLSRLEAIFDFYVVLYGTRERVRVSLTDNGKQWFDRLQQLKGALSDEEAKISATEIAELRALALGLELDADDLEMVVERWNRSIEYGLLDYFEYDDVPSGQSLNFIPDSELKAAAGVMNDAYEVSQSKGFLDPYEEFLRAYEALVLELEGEGGGTCARVKIQLSQDLMLTRTAFRATLTLENERSDGPLTMVGFDLDIRDASGQPADDLFNIAITDLTGMAAIDGTGEIPSEGIGSAQWTLIPRDTAAQETELAYTVGGVITYIQNGTEFTIPVERAPITVRPDAALSLKYFHQRDVFSDDPHTDAIEPSQPYKLAVMVENSGAGTARDLKIISGQPKIVENEKGLFIDFKVIATEVDGQPLSPSLTADFGDLEAGDRKIATWLMTSTLQGLFVDYDATFEHVTGLGDERISLLKNVEIHEMNHMVRALGAKDDGKSDFLVNDVKDPNDYPDTIHLSDGTTELVSFNELGTFSGPVGPGSLSITLNVGALTGWNYFRLPDPGAGDYRLVSMQRSDGLVIPLDFNVWQTDRTFIGNGRRPRYEDILHFLDCGGPGSYTLNYVLNGGGDVEAPESMITALPPTTSANVPVFWTGTDNDEIAFYDIYVSTDGGPFEVWRERTSEPGAVFNGVVGKSYSFYSVATDATGNREAAPASGDTMTMVGENNQAPVITAISNQMLDEGGIFRFQARATDPDGNDGDIRFALGASLPGIVINPVTGEIQWVTSEDQGGSTLSVVVVATDDGVPAATSNESFTIQVVDRNTAPEITQVPPQQIPAGGVLMVDVDATDSDVPLQTLTYSLGAEAPSGMTINATTGLIVWSPTTAQAGLNYVIPVRVTDSGTPAQFSEMSFSVSVSTFIDPDNPPTLGQIPVVLWLKGKVSSLTIQATDPDGDPVSLSANLATAPGSTFTDLGPGQGKLSWNPAGVAADTYQIPVTATANGKSASGNIVIRVAEDNLYWQWVGETFGSEVMAPLTLADLEPSADPDNDKTTNLFEMTFRTDPLSPESFGVKSTTTMLENGNLATVNIRVRRRVGSGDFVDLFPSMSSDVGKADSWAKVPATDYVTAVDADGDDDSDPETETVDFTIFHLIPNGIDLSEFFRMEGHSK